MSNPTGSGVSVNRHLVCNVAQVLAYNTFIVCVRLMFKFMSRIKTLCYVIAD